MLDNGVLLPCVLFDGCLGRDFANGITFHRSVFDSESAAAVLETFMEAGLEPSLNVDHDHDDFVIGDNPSSHPEHLAFNAVRTQHVNLHVAVRAMSVFTFLVIGRERDELLPLREAISLVADSSLGSTQGGEQVERRPVLLHLSGTEPWTRSGSRRRRK
jgi:hypothetical protein